MCISDMISQAVNGIDNQLFIYLNHLSNIIYYLMVMYSAYIWYCYVKIQIFGLKYQNIQLKERLIRIPLYVTTILIISNPVTKLFFTISPENIYSRNQLGVTIHWLVTWGYFAYTVLFIVDRIRKAANSIQRNNLKPYLIFFICPTITAITQMYHIGDFTLQCGITLSIIMIGCTFLQERVSRDNLTGLNNRNAFERYCLNTFDHGGQLFTILMCDLDDFKQINDSQGHIKGDIALKNVADALRKSCGDVKYPIFLCRYGGDEFILAYTSQGDSDKITNKLVKSLDEHTKEVGQSISIGHATFFCNDYNDVEILMGKADIMMYQSKKVKKLAKKK